MLFQKVEKTIVCSGGTIAVNTEAMRGLIKLIYVKAATVTTTFDFSITEPRGSRVVRAYTTETGIIRDNGVLPVEGKYTLTIANASVLDEAFDVFLVVEEKK